jgi:hypothetical protein
MFGETRTQDDDIVVPISGLIFECAICLLVVYYIVLRPLGILQVESQLYDVSGGNPLLVPRCPLNFYFKTWRDYEYSHLLFWMGKDYCWNQRKVELWIICVVPTILISIDFIVVSARAGATIDTVHYVAILLWVSANALWAYCDLGFVLFEPYDDDDHIPVPLWPEAPSIGGSYDYDGTRENKTPWIHGRWLGTWVMLANCLLLIGFYFLWLVLTIKSHRKDLNSPYERFSNPNKSDVVQLPGMPPDLAFLTEPLVSEKETLESNESSGISPGGHLSVIGDVNNDLLGVLGDCPIEFLLEKVETTTKDSANDASQLDSEQDKSKLL